MTLQELLKKPDFPNPHESYSSIKRYDACPKYAKAIKDGKKEKFYLPREIGRVEQAVLAYIDNEAQKQKEQLDVEDIKKIWRETLLRVPHISIGKTGRLWEATLEYAQKAMDNSGQVMGIEYPFQVQLEDGPHKTWFVGRIDKWEILPKKIVRITDNKVSQKIPSSEEVRENDQLLAYAWALVTLLPDVFRGVKKIEIVINCVLQGIAVKSVIDIDKLDYVGEWIVEHWRQMREDKTHEAIPGQWQCLNCPLRCKAYRIWLKERERSHEYKNIKEATEAFLRLKEKRSVLRQEVEKTEGMIIEAIEDNMGPLPVGDRTWYLKPQSRKGATCPVCGYEGEPSNFSVLRSAMGKIKNGIKTGDETTAFLTNKNLTKKMVKTFGIEPIKKPEDIFTHTITQITSKIKNKKKAGTAKVPEGTNKNGKWEIKPY